MEDAHNANRRLIGTKKDDSLTADKTADAISEFRPAAAGKATFGYDAHMADDRVD